jgi:hypothetical protein
MPMVNYDLMYQAAVQNQGNSDQIVYWSRLPRWKNQTLTPNPGAVYLMPFYNTKDAGPMVLEIPRADEGSILGSLDDCWQTVIEDVGLAGVDKEKGGKYLILFQWVSEVLHSSTDLVAVFPRVLQDDTAEDKPLCNPC